MSAPSALSLDLDDTLWPVAPAIAQAEQCLHRWFEDHLPAVAAAWPPPALRALRERIALHCPELAHDFTAQRRLALAHALRASGADETHAGAAFEVFFAARNAVCCYPDVPAALVRLSARLPLASLSNGNADLGRVGLAAHFRVCVTAREVGALKPDARIFIALCRRLHCAPAQVLHAGDDPVLDVEGARQVGLRAAWINREGRAWPGPGPAPELVFADLQALAAWCERQRAA